MIVEKKVRKKEIIVLFFVTQLFFTLQLFAEASECTDDFETYFLSNRSWADKPGVPWEKIGLDESAITEAAIGINSTRKVSMYNYRYDIWYKLPMAGYDPNNTDNLAEPLIVTAEVAVSGSVHDSFPFANHIMVGNAAIGISGEKIAYGVVEVGAATRMYSMSFLTKVGSAVVSEQWYEVKIEYTQVAGANNDTASLYYRPKGTSYWTTVVTDLETGYDLSKDLNVYFLGDVGDKGLNEAHLDNIDVRYPSQRPDSCGDDNTIYLDGDVNADCVVDINDLEIMASEWLN